MADPVEPAHIQRAREWLGGVGLDDPAGAHTGDPDGPGDLFHPFSALRAEQVAPELTITRKVFDSIATTYERRGVSRAAKLEAYVGACAAAVWLMEIRLHALEAKAGNN